MKKTRFAALVTGLLLIATLAYAQAAPLAAPGSPVLATVNGQEITRAEADELIPALVNFEYIADASDYTATVNFLVRQKVMAKKIADMGFDQFTPEELTAFEQEAQAEWQAAIEEYADYNQSDGSEQARAHALEQAVAFYRDQGLTPDMLLDSVKNREAQGRMTAYLMGGYQPTEEEVREVFDQVGPIYQEQYESDVPTYEYMTRLSGQTSWYTPTGYRGIIHILLTGNQELVDQVRTLEARFEEQQQESAEAAEEPVTPEMIELARQAVLDDQADVIAEIYDRLDKGESFETLIGEYGEDPGMTDPDNLQNGYPVHRDSILWDPAFVSGAFSGKMLQVGDVSDPVVGANGIHILKYLMDIPSGLIMTDAIHEEITQYLAGARENEVYGQAFEGWMAEMDIVYHQEAIDQAIEEAAALQQSVEELPPEAVENP